ncbi:MAG: hypothetical protein KJ709_02660 [Nanoarchaeota archaeon]|nr:hypothetical protein [Nanoarchaeota archaeon]
MIYTPPDIGLYATPDDGEVPGGNGWTEKDRRQFLESTSRPDPRMDEIEEAARDSLALMIITQHIPGDIEPPGTLADKIRWTTRKSPEVEHID